MQLEEIDSQLGPPRMNTSNEMSDQHEDIVTSSVSPTDPTTSMPSIKDGEAISQSSPGDVLLPVSKPEIDNDHTIPKPLESFERFVDLPIELRQMIWKFALPPRIVDLMLQSKERRVSRVRSDCPIGDETPGSWDEFFNWKVNNTPLHDLDEDIDDADDEDDNEHYEVQDNEDEDEDAVDEVYQLGGPPGPEPLVNMKLSCPSLDGIFNACHESRDIMYAEGYTRTFCMLGSRATTLFSPRHDTLFVRIELCESNIAGELYFNELIFGPDPEGRKGCGLDQVEKLAIAINRVCDEEDLELDWTRDLSSWIIRACRNLKEITLAVEYDIGGDYSDLAFMELADFVGGQAAKPQVVGGTRLSLESQDTSESEASDDAAILYDDLKETIVQRLSKDIDLPSTSSPELKKLKIDRRIVTTAEIKETFRKPIHWYDASSFRAYVEISHWKSNTTSNMVVHEKTTIGQLGALWLLEWAPNVSLIGPEKIEISLHGVNFNLSTRILDIEELEHNAKFKIKVWVGQHWH